MACLGGRPRARAPAVAAASWILIAILPVLPILYVAPDLQQSRYLYLSATGWSGLLVVCASAGRARLSSIAGAGAVAALIALSIYGTTAHLAPWIEASRLRDRVEAAAVEAGIARCSPATISGLPDSVAGAYVFRNGAPEAFARELHVDVRLAADGGGGCAFRWSETQQAFVRAGTE
jgi:hypothetical protein